LLEAMGPFLGGGSMISLVRPEGSTWADGPSRFEAGTPNIADVIAFGAALDYLDGLGMEGVRAHEAALTAYALDALRAIDGLRIHGPLEVERRGGAVSFTVDGIHPHDMSTILDGYGIAIRAGHHCAQILMRRLEVPATNRASFYVYNHAGEVDALVRGVREAQKVFLRADRAAV
jgi:cysteine desulfurase/selenocysteine lyase